MAKGLKKENGPEKGSVNRKREIRFGRREGRGEENTEGRVRG